MSAPGMRIRQIATRWCSARTLERLIDPTIADMQAECADAVRHGRPWHCRRMRLAGYFSLVRVVVLHACLRTVEIVRDPNERDHDPIRRSLVASTLTMLTGTVLLVLPFVVEFVPSHLRRPELTLLVIPQALPLSIPVGLMFGILWGFGRVSASYRGRAVIVSCAVVASFVSFLLLAWLVPAANQAYRTTVSGRSLAKGYRELSLTELRTVLDRQVGESITIPARTKPLLAFEYHKRWALAAAPLSLALFAVALTRRRRWGRTALLMAGGLAIFGYYFVMYSAMNTLREMLWPIAVAWLPNLTFLLLSLALARNRDEQARLAV